MPLKLEKSVPALDSLDIPSLPLTQDVPLGFVTVDSLASPLASGLLKSAAISYNMVG